MEEEMYYATLSVLLQEQSTPQNWKKQEMAELIFLKVLVKRNKNLSIRNP
jgi:hypothetical protein